MWVRKQWEKQAEIANEILAEKGIRLTSKEKAELLSIIKYVDMHSCFLDKAVHDR